jgi:hypothetical protein
VSSKVLRDFEELRTTENLERARFLDGQGYDDFCAALYSQPSRSDVFQIALQVLPHYVRQGGGAIRATPEAGPNDLPDAWYFALRDEMGDVDDWRTPQIIVSSARREEWNNSITGSNDESEVRIVCEDLDQVHERVIAFLGSYPSHKHAKSDRDPWDLRRTKTQHAVKPCCLPRPVELEGIHFEMLKPALDRIRGFGWLSKDSTGAVYRFIPPDDWDPLDWKSEQTKATCRGSGSFRRDDTPDHRHTGFVDCEDRIWEWDLIERHWDVQLESGGYYSISHTGRLLRDNS